MFLSRYLASPLTSYHRYLRALAAMYIRLTFQGPEVYSILEPMMKDYRKLRVRNTGMPDALTQPNSLP